MREEIVRGESDPLIQNSCSFDFLILNLKLLKIDRINLLSLSRGIARDSNVNTFAPSNYREESDRRICSNDELAER